MHSLVAISYSPWSEKARWALDLRRVAYSEEEYVPMIGELALRLRLRRLTGKVTVPVLFADDGRTFTDSFEIARFAEDAGQGPSLFPPGKAGEIAQWNARSETILQAGRALSIAKAFADPAARNEAVPRFLPKPLRPLIGRVGVTYLRTKYNLVADQDASVSIVAEGLHDFRKALSGRKYLYDTLSYADVVMAVSLQLVAPVADKFIHLGKATRRVCTHIPFLTDFADIVEWRDSLYAEHRRAT